MNDEQIEPTASMLVYHPVDQEFGAGRVFVRTGADRVRARPDNHADRARSGQRRAGRTAPPRSRTSAPKCWRRIGSTPSSSAALPPSRSRSPSSASPACSAFSVSGRTREFGIRLAIGSQPRHLLAGVLTEGFVMAAVRHRRRASPAATHSPNSSRATCRTSSCPDLLPVIGSAAILLIAAIIASRPPAARAARVDVMQALRSE